MPIDSPDFEPVTYYLKEDLKTALYGCVLICIVGIATEALSHPRQLRTKPPERT
jgi:hypothetical protein